MTLVPYNPELNSQAERWNRTHIEGVRTMLRDLDVRKDLWGEVLSTHVYIHKWCPSSTLPGNIISYQKVFTQTPCIKPLHLFSSKCFVKVPDETHSKLDDKAKEYCLIRYEGDSIYMVMDVRKKKLCSHNVILLEGTDICTNSTKTKSMESKVRRLRQMMMAGVLTWPVTMRLPSDRPNPRYGGLTLQESLNISARKS